MEDRSVHILTNHDPHPTQFQSVPPRAPHLERFLFLIIGTIIGIVLAFYYSKDRQLIESEKQNAVLRALSESRADP